MQTLRFFRGPSAALRPCNWPLGHVECWACEISVCVEKGVFDRVERRRRRMRRIRGG